MLKKFILHYPVTIEAYPYVVAEELLGELGKGTPAKEGCRTSPWRPIARGFGAYKDSCVYISLAEDRSGRAGCIDSYVLRIRNEIDNLPVENLYLDSCRKIDLEHALVDLFSSLEKGGELVVDHKGKIAAQYMGLRKDNGEKIIGSLLVIGDNNKINPGRFYICPGVTASTVDDDGAYFGPFFQVDSRKTFRCTGHKDKNGNLIFDGHICSDGKCKVQVHWDRHQWMCKIIQSESVLTRGLSFPLWQWDNCKENAFRELEIIGHVLEES